MSLERGLSPLMFTLKEDHRLAYSICAGMCGRYTSEKMDEADHSHQFIVLRGGSYYTAHYYWHSESGAMRNNSHLKVHLMSGAMNRYGTVGFRCVKEVT